MSSGKRTKRKQCVCLSKTDGKQQRILTVHTVPKFTFVHTLSEFTFVNTGNIEMTAIKGKNLVIFFINMFFRMDNVNSFGKRYIIEQLLISH